MSVAEERTFELFVNPNNLGFRAAVALYPLCSAAGARPSIPTLLFVGEPDDWAPAKDCARTSAEVVGLVPMAFDETASGKSDKVLQDEQ